MPPASRAFFLFLSNLNHSRPAPQCKRLALQAPLRHLQRRYSSHSSNPLTSRAPADVHPRPPSPNARLRNSPQPKQAHPPTSSPSPPEHLKYGVPLSEWQTMSVPARFYHFRDAVYRSRSWPSLLRASPRARRWLYTFLLFLFPTMFFWVHSPFHLLHVQGPSMSPTLNPAEEDDRRDWLLVQAWNINDGRLTRRNARMMQEAGELSNGRFERGMLVVYHIPHRPGEVAVKRVVAVPGDRVRPLEEYEGRRIWERERQKEGSEVDGEEQYSVLVPYNHIWVEGDVGKFNKSVDSNWFGPISQELVVGEVKLIWSPFWHVLGAKSVKWRESTWPARVQGRVDENVAWRNATNPDALRRYEALESGEIDRLTEYVKTKPEVILRNFVDDKKARQQYRDLYMMCARVTKSPQSQPEHMRMAKDFVQAMEVVVPRDVWLGKQSVSDKPVRKRWVPEDRSRLNKES